MGKKNGPYKIEIGKVSFRLKEIMDERGIDIKTLSEMTGINNSNLCFIVNNKKTNVTITTLLRICVVLHLKVEDLIAYPYDTESNSLKAEIYDATINTESK